MNKEEITSFFISSMDDIGSYARMSALLKNYPQQINEEIIYLIGGSWAIEFISGQKIDHDDIDLILLSNPPYYLDDAIIEEEKCNGVIPLSKSYFDRSITKCKNPRNGRIVFVPNLNLQLCFKLIGQLESSLPERAINQLKLLLNLYDSESTLLNQKEIEHIYTCCLPEYIDSKLLSKETVDAITLFKEQKIYESIELFRKIHRIINSSLQKEFSKLT